MLCAGIVAKRIVCRVVKVLTEAFPQETRLDARSFKNQHRANLWDGTFQATQQSLYTI